MEPKKPNFLTLVYGGLSEQPSAEEASLDLLGDTVAKISRKAKKELVPVHHVDAARASELLEE